MEALKNVLPFILILGGLGVWSLDKKYSNKFKGTLSGILFSSILPESAEVLATAEFAFTNYKIETL